MLPAVKSRPCIVIDMLMATEPEALVPLLENSLDEAVADSEAGSIVSILDLV